MYSAAVSSATRETVEHSPHNIAHGRLDAHIYLWVRLPSEVRRSQLEISMRVSIAIAFAIDDSWAKAWRAVRFDRVLCLPVCPLHAPAKRFDFRSILLSVKNSYLSIDLMLDFFAAHILIAMPANYTLIHDSVSTHSLLICSVCVCVHRSSSSNVVCRVVWHRQREVIKLVVVVLLLSHTPQFLWQAFSLSTNGCQ